MGAVYEICSYLINKNIVAYMFHFGEIFGASYDSIHGEWSFDLMIVRPSTPFPAG